MVLVVQVILVVLVVPVVLLAALVVLKHSTSSTSSTTSASSASSTSSPCCLAALVVRPVFPVCTRLWIGMALQQTCNLIDFVDNLADRTTSAALCMSLRLSDCLICSRRPHCSLFNISFYYRGATLPTFLQISCSFLVLIPCQCHGRSTCIEGLFRLVLPAAS